jgi:hypothetical protein
LIGPVRSARYYFIQLTKGFDVPLAHAGGNQDALALIGQLKTKDLDEIYNAADYFWRDKTRKAPHNLYTSTDLLVKGAQTKGYALKPLELSPAGYAGEGNTSPNDIKLKYEGIKEGYEVTWHFNGSQYERQINGKPHLMKDGAVPCADNVLVMVAESKEVVKEELESLINLIAKGQACFFIEGKVIKGSWEKSAVSSPLKFYDDKGQLLKIKAGKTWVQVVPDAGSLKF